MTNETRKGILVTVVLLVIGAIWYLQTDKAAPGGGDIVKTEVGGVSNIAKDALYDKAVEISGATGYLNTGEKPITIGEFVGKKIVLVDFWTYSCINCQRTLPYLTAWYDKYKNQGLEIVSIHTPEFEFEKDPKNVKAAAEKFGVAYPIVQDNDYGTWRAYENRYWPRKYLIDIDGYIVYDHIGEGGYDETEKKIQELLKERNEKLGVANSVDTSIVKPASAVAISNVGSPETYFGSLRNNDFGNGKTGVAYENTFVLPKAIDRNTLYLEGKWNITDEYAESRGTGKIVYRYKAKNVYLVVSAAKGVSATILLDGKPVGMSAGKDVKDGKILFKADALYHLIGHPGDAEEHVLEIIMEGGGARAFAFTFG